MTFKSSKKHGVNDHLLTLLLSMLWTYNPTLRFILWYMHYIVIIFCYRMYLKPPPSQRHIARSIQNIVQRMPHIVRNYPDFYTQKWNMINIARFIVIQIYIYIYIYVCTYYALWTKWTAKQIFSKCKLTETCSSNCICFWQQLLLA